jgi:hypothetical protein
MRALEQGNRRRANYQFHVGQDVLVNQRRHHREQLGPIGPLLPQAAGPFRIRRQITANTFELDIPAALAPRMRPVFHASELIPYETRVLEPLVDVPPHDQAQHNTELLVQDEDEISQALQLLRRPDTSLVALPVRESGLDDPAEWFSLQAVTTHKLLPRADLPHQKVRFHPTIRVAYLPEKLPFTPDNTLLREQDEGLVLSALLATSPTTGPILHDTTRHSTPPLALLYDYPSHPPAFAPEEEVMLAPSIFLAMCQNFGVHPEIDLFASSNMTQLPAYYTADKQDSLALGCNAFSVHWDPTRWLYANPPWSLLDQVIDKIQREGSRLLLVTPYWPNAPWFQTLRQLTLDRRKWSQPLYQDPNGALRPAPSWATRFTLVDGSQGMPPVM